MQSTVSRQALGAFASKIHPPTPLSPRESQQLLSLLTTSFRAHLDREHPPAVPRGSNNARIARDQLAKDVRDATVFVSSASSHSFAAEHIDSILSNPLFARRPLRRGSESVVIDMLADPLNWFYDQIAVGAANIYKADTCLKLARDNGSGSEFKGYNETRAATAIAEWLRSSGLENSKEFINTFIPQAGTPRRLTDTLVPMLLLAQETRASLWRWFTRAPKQRTEETGVNASRILAFRTQLLVDMIVGVQESSLDRALAIFLHAHKMVQTGAYGLTHNVLQPAGASLVNRISAKADPDISPELYGSFLLSTSDWLGPWSRVVQSMLWLHHPSSPTTLPALSLIQDPQGAAAYATAKKSRQKFLVQLCLEVAGRSLEEGKSSDAQLAMNFTKEHFAEMVLSKTRSTKHQDTGREKARQAKENLEILDRLLPA